MSWTDDQTTPRYTRPALNLQAFLSPSEPVAQSLDPRLPAPRASGVAPRGEHVRTHSIAVPLPPSAAGVPHVGHHSAAFASAAARSYPPALPVETAEQPPAAQTGPRIRSTILPEPEARVPEKPQPAPTQVLAALPSFELRELLRDPYNWLSNPQRALLLLALVSSGLVVALLCLGGF